MTPHHTPDTRVTQRTKADTRAVVARVLRGADPDAVFWTVPREAGNRRAHD
jgi:hypothetical protein